jgi:hypothetical protein
MTYLDGAVEAAVVVPSERAGSDGDSYWQQLDEFEKKILREETQAMLEAAEPFIRADERAKLEAQLLSDDGPFLLTVREAVAGELEACGYRDEDGDPLSADGCEWIANEVSDRIKKDLPISLASHPTPDGEEGRAEIRQAVIEELLSDKALHAKDYGHGSQLLGEANAFDLAADDLKTELAQGEERDA